MNKIGQYWKAIVAGCGVALMAWNQVSPGLSALLPTSWQPAISAVVAVLTVIATYGVPNKTTAVGKHAAP